MTGSISVSYLQVDQIVHQQIRPLVLKMDSNESDIASLATSLYTGGAFSGLAASTAQSLQRQFNTALANYVIALQELNSAVGLAASSNGVIHVADSQAQSTFAGISVPT